MWPVQWWAAIFEYWNKMDLKYYLYSHLCHFPSTNIFGYSSWFLDNQIYLNICLKILGNPYILEYWLWSFFLVNMLHMNIFSYSFGTYCGLQIYSDICSCPIYDIRSSLDQWHMTWYMWHMTGGGGESSLKITAPKLL